MSTDYTGWFTGSVTTGSVPNFTAASNEEVTHVNTPEMGTYIVKSGDIFIGSAAKFGITVDAIVSRNGIKNTNVIF